MGIPPQGAGAFAAMVADGDVARQTFIARQHIEGVESLLAPGQSVNEANSRVAMSSGKTWTVLASVELTMAAWDGVTDSIVLKDGEGRDAQALRILGASEA